MSVASIQPVITSNAFCDHIFLESGSNLIIASNATLTIGNSVISDKPGQGAEYIRRIFGGEYQIK